MRLSRFQRTPVSRLAFRTLDCGCLNSTVNVLISFKLGANYLHFDASEKMQSALRTWPSPINNLIWFIGVLVWFTGNVELKLQFLLNITEEGKPEKIASVCVYVYTVLIRVN